MLSQCLSLFGFFSLILVLVYWVNQAVSLFDALIADGQTALVFFEFTLLTLPNLIRIVLPVAAFAAVLYVTNRMSSESELTVMQATGYSAKRMARPVAIFGVIAGIMMAILIHVLVPISQERLSIRQSEVAENISGRLLREGVFTHPGEGSTLYLREITANGELVDVFLSRVQDDGRDQIFTAERAFLVRTENGPQLVMIDGQSQTLDPNSGGLFVTTFDDLVIDIAALMDSNEDRAPSLRELSTAQLLNPTPELMEITGKSAGAFVQEGQERLSEPLFPLVAALLGFGILLSGGFTRFGIWKQILLAVAMLVVINGVEGVAAQRIVENPSQWYLAYAPALLGFVVAGVALMRADRNRRVPAQAPNTGHSDTHGGGATAA